MDPFHTSAWDLCLSGETPDFVACATVSKKKRNWSPQDCATKECSCLGNARLAFQEMSIEDKRLEVFELSGPKSKDFQGLLRAPSMGTHAALPTSM